MSSFRKAPGMSSRPYPRAPRTMILCSSLSRRFHARGITRGHAWTRQPSSVLCERLPGRQASRTGLRSLRTGCATATGHMPSIARRHSLWCAIHWYTAILRLLMNTQRHARIKALLNTCLYKERERQSQRPSDNPLTWLVLRYKKSARLLATLCSKKSGRS